MSRSQHFIASSLLAVVACVQARHSSSPQSAPMATSSAVEWVSTSALPRVFATDSSSCATEAQRLTSEANGSAYAAEWTRCLRTQRWRRAMKRGTPAGCEIAKVTWADSLPAALAVTDFTERLEQQMARMVPPDTLVGRILFSGDVEPGGITIVAERAVGVPEYDLSSYELKRLLPTYGYEGLRAPRFTDLRGVARIDSRCVPYFLLPDYE